MRDVVRTVVQLLGSVAAAFAQHVGVGEGGGAGRYVHGGAAGEVEAAEEIGPAGGVPSPAGDGVVDEGRPDEHVEDAGEHAAAFGDGTDGEGDAGSG